MEALQVETIKNVKASIVQLQLLHSGELAIATQSRKIIFYDPVTTEQKILQLNTKSIFEKNKVCFSPNGKFIAYVNDNRTIHIINTKKNKIISSFSADKHTIDIIVFDPSSHYLFVGTTQGRVLEYSLLAGCFLSRLASFPEHKISELIALKSSFVSAFAFLGTRFASSGYGGSIVIANTHTHANTLRICSGRSRVDALAFINESTLLAGNKDSTLKKIDILTLRALKQITLDIGSIQQIALFNNLPYACVASQYNTITLVNSLKP